MMDLYFIYTLLSSLRRDKALLFLALYGHLFIIIHLFIFICAINGFLFHCLICATVEYYWVFTTDDFSPFWIYILIIK